MSKTLIIAEAGVNHNGSMQIAKQLIDVAAKAGVDYVKFQTFKADCLVGKSAQKAEYQKRNIGGSDNSQYAMLKALELSDSQHYELIDYCNLKGVKFFSTAFDLQSIDFLNSLEISLWKIPSGEITNFPYLKKIGQTCKPVILSTGMSTITEIAEAIEVLVKYGTPKEKITLLHCTTEYPAPKNEVNLRAIATMRDYFNLNVGYSDHTEGIEIPVAAVVIGATIIEKHFTLDRTMDGPDHRASLEPDELCQMVANIRNVEMAMGCGVKEPAEAEKPNILIARKSIVASQFIKKGDIFSEDNLTTKRPANGISPMLWETVMGAISPKDFNQDEPIEL